MFPFLHDYPYSDLHEIDLAYMQMLVAAIEGNNKQLLAWKATHEEEYEELAEKVDGLVNSLVDVIEPWDSSVAYHIYSLVSWEGQNYIALKDVPVGTMITNTEYWQPANTVIQQINAIGQTVTDLSEETDEKITEINTKLESIKFWYYPEEFGAVGDGTTDDTEAFQTMFDTVPNGATILLKANAYKVHNGLTLEKSFVKMVGQFGRDEYGPGFAIDSAAGTFLTVTGSGCSFNHLAFTSETRNNDQIFIVFNADNETASGNIDAIIDNCVILRAGIAVATYGRNVRIYDCLLSTCFCVLDIRQTTNIVTDIRGFDVVNNRFHSSLIAIRNNATNAQTPKNIFISNNFMDMADILFTGNGGGVVISGNYLDQERGAYDQCISINANQSGEYDVISGNTLKSVAAQTAHIARVNTPVVVSGNTFINFAGGFTIMAECSVLSNTLLNVAENINGVYPFTFGATASGVCANNTVKSSKNITSGSSNMQLQNNYYIR